MSVTPETEAMYEQTPPPPLRIRNAQELLEALRDPEITQRLAVLRTVYARPDLALAFGKFQEQDVIDELIAQANHGNGSTYWQALAVALSGFRGDPRVTNFFRKALLAGKRPAVVNLAAGYLQNEADTDGSIAAAFRSLVLQDNSEMHARVAANVLVSGEKPQDAQEQVRTIMLAEGEQAREKMLAQVDLARPDIRAAWLAELNGTYAFEARQCLERLEEPALRLVDSGWRHLSEESRQWLLFWAVSIHPETAVQRVNEVLNSEDASPVLQLAALECLSSLDRDTEELLPRLEHFLTPDNDPRLRLAAIHAGAQCDDWRQFLGEEEPLSVRLAAIGALAADEGEHAVPDLLTLLESSSWEVRSAATSALATLGTVGVQAAQRLITHPREEVRMAAARILADSAHAS